ncbi:MAG: hypothetical protein WAK55_19410, partial [Xanthobacteraceae bacterium]
MPSQPLNSPSDREIISASILKSRRHLRQLQGDLHDTVLRSQVTILQTQELITKADELLLSSLGDERRPGGFFIVNIDEFCSPLS